MSQLRIVCALSLLAITIGRIEAQSVAPPETARIAAQILDSPKAQNLSSSGRNMLMILSGRNNGGEPATAGRIPGLAGTSRIPQAAANGADVMVNNPDQDLRANLDYSTQSETAVAAFNNTVVVAFNDSGQVTTPFPPFSLTGYSRSVDGGASFLDIGALPPPVAGFVGGDPGLVVDRLGTFYASSLAYAPTLVPPGFANTVGIWRSTDGGLTWPAIAAIPPGSNAIVLFADKPLIAADNSTSRFSGNVYVSYTAFTAPTPFSPIQSAIVLSRSGNRAASFSPPIIISEAGTDNQGAEPAVGPGGEVYVAWLKFGPGIPGIMVAKSSDGGVNFGPPVFAAPLTPIGFATGVLSGGFRVNSFPRIDVSPANGHVYVVYSSNPQGADASDVYLVRSTDGGATWSAPLRVNDDVTTNDQFFPDVAIDRQGLVQVIWYDRRNDPDNNKIEVFQTTFSARGVSQGSNAPLSSVPFPPAIGYDPFINPSYMGDYLDNKVIIRADGPARGFVSAWGDNRRKIVTAGGTRNDQDVFFRRVDPNQ